jgi:hypothetical protein
MTNGWTIKVTVPGQPIRLYVAAESDPKVALILANKALGTSPPRDRLETVGPIPGRLLDQIGVKAGEIKDVTDNPPNL